MSNKGAVLTDVSSWTDRLGHAKMRTFTDQEGHLWVEQNPDKASVWAKLAREGHSLAWEFEGPGGSYTGRMLFDGEITTPSEVRRRGGQ